jgi:hydrogenase-4 component B
MTPEVVAYALFALVGAGYVGGALATVGGRGAAARRFTVLGALGGSAATLALGLWCLGTGVTPTVRLRFLALADFALRVDGLSAFFLVLSGLTGVAVALYWFGYSPEPKERESPSLLGSTLNGLLLSLVIQAAADNVLTFLITWEAMSLAAYLLVLTEHDQAGAVRAANWYIAVTHAGFAALVAAFLVLAAGDPAATFETMRSTSLPPHVRDAVFALVLFGFGAKAGIVPLHVWLPMAHPVAPSHVSALMSGVVIKMGVYGFLRVTLDLLGGGPAWWGGIVLILGAVSALLGVLYALMEHDLKRLLAYHSVENVGIIFIALGAGLMFQSYRLPALAVLGMVGGLYHTLNHACFKGLLFLGAGAVAQATRTHDMEQLGGLIKRMPRTAVFFLVGSAAIAALPPLNGFASEWLVFQVLLGGSAVPQPEVAVIMPIAVAMLALTSGLAVACFVKAFGITFLALPRTAHARDAREAPLSMQVGMLVLAVVCIALGLGPALVVPALGRIVAGLGGLSAGGVRFTLAMPLGVSGAVGEMSPTSVAAGLAIVAALTWGVLQLCADRRIRVGETWGCGRMRQTPRMEYTATAFAEPLQRIFAELYRPTEDLSIDFHPASKYFVQSIEYRSEIHPWFQRLLYTPVLSGLRAVAGRVRSLQAGSLHLYLMYMAVALLLLLGAARWPR